MNSTIERTQTTTEVRKAKAEAHLKQLQSERENILTQQKTAQETIEQLNGAIVTAGRSGEADTLASLRAARREAEESVQDLERTLPGLDREIRLAEGEMVMSERAVQSESWNTIRAEQAQLLKTIEESVNMLVSAITDKTRLAHRQQKILANVCPGDGRSPDLIRHDLAHAITARLEGHPTTALRAIDWSSWPMTQQGDLLR